MQCTNPVLIKGPGHSDKVRAPIIGGKTTGMLVPCGKCISCRIAKTREWAMRIMHELESRNNVGCFLTLSYDDNFLPENESLCKADLQKFFKRFRRNHGNIRFKYFACGEYGDTTYRPHYHIAIMGWEPDPSDLFVAAVKDGKKYFYSGMVCDLWPFGFNVCGTLTMDSAAYVSSYIQKKYNGKLGYITYGDNERPFQLQSQGIGLDFFKSNYNQIVEDGGIRHGSVKISVPRYYRKKEADSGLSKLSVEARSRALQSEGDINEFYDGMGFTEHEAIMAIALSRRQSNSNAVVKARYKNNNVY